MSSTKKSTSVRSLRAAMALLERMSPELGARVVERFWFTVPRRRPPATALPPGGTAFTVDVGGRRVRGRRWGHDERVVYLVHGWGGRADQLGGLVQPLRAAGLSVVVHDSLGHGDSDPGTMGPGRSNVLEHVASLRAVVAAHGPAQGVVAHSLGALAAAVAMRDGIVPERAVYLAPMADAESYTKGFTAMLGGGTRTWQAFIGRLEQRFDRSLGWFDMAAAAHDAAADDGAVVPSLLVVHDRQDRETRWEGSAAVVRDWPSARLHTTTGLGHNRLLADPDVIREAAGFLAGRTVAAVAA